MLGMKQPVIDVMDITTVPNHVDEFETTIAILWSILIMTCMLFINRLYLKPIKYLNQYFYLFCEVINVFFVLRHKLLLWQQRILKKYD